VVMCPDSTNKGTLPQGGKGANLEVTGECSVGAGTYMYGNVNIYGTKDAPASLTFKDQMIEFWAHSILVENHGSLLAGFDIKSGKIKPIGKTGGKLTIYIYGKDGESDIACKSQTDAETGPCGVPLDVWNSNSDPNKDPVPTTMIPGVASDYFYNYDFMPFDNGPDAKSYFGSKVLAVSFGGTLKLFGIKGASLNMLDPSDAGTSWGRLQGSIKPNNNLDKPNVLTVDVNHESRKPQHNTLNWQKDDHIVVTTTDYMADHSEELVITAKPIDNKDGTFTIEYRNADPNVTTGVKWPHNGDQYSLSNKKHSGIKRLNLDLTAVETRAAVGLLSRSIRIYSGGGVMGEPFPNMPPFGNPSDYFGASTIARQGFAAFQMQGVELGQLGEGGRIGHYAVHFHLARKTPKDTFVRDCSIWDSMTRWITIHATQGVELARNVGYKSIGHGYYIEDGTETDNKLYSNLGVFARAAVDDDQNPRKVPGILAADPHDNPTFTYHSDYEHPTVFWIMNGWNDLEYNMAAGADTCGACYWLPPGLNSGKENTFADRDHPKPNERMKWTGYASMQDSQKDGFGHAGETPLMKFVGNSCTSAMSSFQVIGDIEACQGANADIDDAQHLRPIPNKFAPKPAANLADETYYPRIYGGLRPTTFCGTDSKAAADADCADLSKYPICANGALPLSLCAVTVLDHYTSSFNYAPTNVSAIWLRNKWYLVTNSALTDIQNGGLTFVTGGDYTRSSVIQGFWALAEKSVFVGQTQDPNAAGANPFADALGPFSPLTGLQCPVSPNKTPQFCISKKDGLVVLLTAFVNNQRFFNIYDGPSYQDSNAYLDITTDILKDCGTTGTCDDSLKLYARKVGIPKNKDQQCYLPNAAIGWKQPNGFFYPPAFHSRNLYFDDVDIRHFVIEPLFKDHTFQDDTAAIAKRYCTSATNMFSASFTDIDRQTVLNDDDGSLTGLLAFPDKGEQQTISVNYTADFFTRPIQAPECASDIDAKDLPAEFPATAKTSPYDYLTTVVYPACAREGGPKPPDTEAACGYGPPPATEPPENPDWDSNCTFGDCYGVPLYRQGLTKSEMPDDSQSIRMMGGKLWQRDTLTANNGVYYVDTAAGVTKQGGSKFKNIFQGNHTYYVLFIYAKPMTHQKYQLWVGTTGFDKDKDVFVTRVVPDGSHFNFIDGQNADGTGSGTAWPSTWKTDYNAAKGILTVTVDMGFSDFQKYFEQAATDFCQPGPFCTLASNKCVCNPKNPDALGLGLCKANNICQDWAGKDIDWPAGGAYGFGVRFPAGFVADSMNHRPTTSPDSFCIKKTDTAWDVPLKRPDEDIAGERCKDTPITPDQFCM
jgi:hypothetical protein